MIGDSSPGQGFQVRRKNTKSVTNKNEKLESIVKLLKKSEQKKRKKACVVQLMLYYPGTIY
jgi:hypothetical protein